MIKKQAIKKSGEVKVTFTLPAGHPHGPSSVVGDFNGWDPLKNPFAKRSNGTFSTSVTLGAGERHHFRYLGDGNTWFDEPEADGHESTGHGTHNCVLLT
ncbi:MAG: isoamylase early set domain-containing protein [Rhodothermales bacterium]